MIQLERLAPSAPTRLMRGLDSESVENRTREEVPK